MQTFFSISVYFDYRLTSVITVTTWIHRLICHEVSIALSPGKGLGNVRLPTELMMMNG